jgi:hypothetical protein
MDGFGRKVEQYFSEKCIHIGSGEDINLV